jgi:hypothetical protein
MNQHLVDAKSWAIGLIVQPFAFLGTPQYFADFKAKKRIGNNLIRTSIKTTESFYSNRLLMK